MHQGSMAAILFISFLVPVFSPMEKEDSPISYPNLCFIEPNIPEETDDFEGYGVSFSLLTDENIQNFLKSEYDAGKLIYFYGCNNSQDEVRRFIHIANSPSKESRSPTLPTIVSDKDTFSIVSVHNQNVSSWYDLLVLPDAQITSEDSHKIITRNFSGQMAAKSKKKSLNALVSSTAVIESYVPGDYDSGIDATYTLYQNDADWDAQQNYYASRVSLQPFSYAGKNCTQVYLQLTIPNTNAYLSDYAPKNETDVELSVSGTIGTDGASVSVGTTLSSRPIYQSKYYQDRKAAAMQWNTNALAVTLNDAQFAGGISWNQPGIVPRCEVNFSGKFGTFDTRTRTFTMEGRGRDIR